MHSPDPTLGRTHRAPPNPDARDLRGAELTNPCAEPAGGALGLQPATLDPPRSAWRDLGPPDQSGHSANMDRMDHMDHMDRMDHMGHLGPMDYPGHPGHRTHAGRAVFPAPAASSSDPSEAEPSRRSLADADAWPCLIALPEETQGPIHKQRTAPRQPSVPVLEPTAHAGRFAELAGMATFAQWLANFASACTRRAYASDVRDFVAFSGLRSQGDLLRVARSHVLAWRHHLHAQGLSPSTQRRKLAALSSLLEHLVDE